MSLSWTSRRRLASLLVIGRVLLLSRSTRRRTAMGTPILAQQTLETFVHTSATSDGLHIIRYLICITHSISLFLVEDISPWLHSHTTHMYASAWYINNASYQLRTIDVGDHWYYIAWCRGYIFNTTTFCHRMMTRPIHAVIRTNTRKGINADMPVQPDIIDRRTMYTDRGLGR